MIANIMESGMEVEDRRGDLLDILRICEYIRTRSSDMKSRRRMAPRRKLEIAYVPYNNNNKDFKCIKNTA